ncbi:MAG: DUF1015 family protein [Bacteroidales bacterium]|nr:DUF1015 family protein [Bacteroidales bacterium]
MVRVKPFAALRPPRELAQGVCAPPYDVVSSAEAAALAGPASLLHITRPEIDFTPFAGEHEQRSYDKAVQNFALWKQKGLLVQDGKPCYYLYAQTMGTHTQYGFVLCAHIGDYENGAIKRHELTRKDKEDDRMVHISLLNANLEPVFFAFERDEELAAVIEAVSAGEKEYSFTDENGFRHDFWVIGNDNVIARISEIFNTRVEAFYVADGHHRTAAAVRVGRQKREANPLHRGDEEYNWFMAVCFPKDQLRIMDYNRVVKDLGTYAPESFLHALEEDFTVEAKGPVPYRPGRPHNFSMYLQGCWYSLTLKEGRCCGNSCLERLDVSILSTLVLDRLLGIRDLRSDKRIDFVGGIRGLDELARRVDSGGMEVAFALYPVSMEQLMEIADGGQIMPPKTTWFEPKLRSGLAIHSLE